MKHFEYTSKLGWSFTRYDTFAGCKRQYFYHYYGKHDGEVDQAKLRTLRNLTSVPLDIGNVTHECIASLLRRLVKNSDAPVDREKFLNYAGNKAADAVKQSSYAEVYYRGKEEVSLEEILPGVERALSNLLESDRYGWLIREAADARNEWVIEPPGYGETRIDGLKAYCKVDFLFPVDESLYILDWKTGKPREKRHSTQLRGYSAWAAYHYDRDVGRIRPMVAYLLPEYSEIDIQLNEFDLEDFTGRVRQETTEMYAYCRNVEGNIPLRKDSFTLTDNLSACEYCNYREFCGR